MSFGTALSLGTTALGALGSKSKKSKRTFSPFTVTTARGGSVSAGEGGSAVNLGTGLPNNLRRVLLPELKDLSGNVKRDINTLRSIENPFVRARVRPLEQRAALFRDEQRRGLQRRGVTGTLAANELFRTDFLTERELGDARVQATAESLGAVLQQENFLRALFQDARGLGQDELEQALAELGLGLSAQELLLGGTGEKEESGDVTEGLKNAGSLIKGVNSLFGSGVPGL